jgi:hypothetical protein
MSEEQESSATETSAEQAGSLLTEAASGTAEASQEDVQQVESAADEKKPEGAPETYEFKLAEGVEGGQALEEFKALAKEYDLPQDKAQGLVDLYQKLQHETMEKWAETKKAWADQVRNDKDLGGKNFDETMQVCGRFLKELNLGEGFMKYMDDYGLGSHPEFVRGIYAMALKTMEDKPVMSGAGPGTPTPESRMKNLYGQSNMT